MKRSPLLIAAFVDAWRDCRLLRDAWEPTEEGFFITSRPMEPAKIAEICAYRATECEQAYVAAFGPVET